MVVGDDVTVCLHVFVSGCIFTYDTQDYLMHDDLTLSAIAILISSSTVTTSASSSSTSLSTSEGRVEGMHLHELYKATKTHSPLLSNSLPLVEQGSPLAFSKNSPREGILLKAPGIRTVNVTKLERAFRHCS